MFLLGWQGGDLPRVKGKNFGVGCPGGVEAVAHSLVKYRNSELALVKIDFKMP